MLPNNEIIIDNISILDKFSNALDYPKKLNKIISPIIKNKRVIILEITGDKYLNEFGKETKQCYGINLSSKLNEKELNKFLDNIENNSIDIIIGSWLSTDLTNINDRSQMISKVKSKLKKGGEIYLIENDNISEFEEITGKYQLQPNPTLVQNTYIMNELGYKMFYRFETFFKFEDIAQAQEIFGNIWGEQITSKIRNRTIQIRIIIFKKTL